MNPDEINAALSLVRGEVTIADAGDQSGRCKINIGDGTTIDISQWRMSLGGIAVLTSFDQGPGRSEDFIDANAELEDAIVRKAVTAVRVDPARADLLLSIEGGIELRGFHLRRLFEDWEVSLADGTAFWSNHVAL